MIATDLNVQKAILDRAHHVTAKQEGNDLVLNTYQDVEPHLDYAAKCRRAEREDRGTFGKRGEFRRTMVVPFNVMTAVAQQLGIPAGQIFDTEHNRRIMAELKRPEFKLFRTTNDKHIGG